MNLNFLTLKCWLDEDGFHIWQRHDCLNGEATESMLPHPTWSTLGAEVWPSIMCSTCGLHAFGTITPRPADAAIPGGCLP